MYKHKYIHKYKHTKKQINTQTNKTQTHKKMNIYIQAQT